MLAYFVVCITMMGILCIVLAYLYLVAATRTIEIPELVESEPVKDSPRS